MSLVEGKTVRRYLGRGLAVVGLIMLGCTPSEARPSPRIGYIDPNQGSEVVDILKGSGFSISRGTFYRRDLVNSFVLEGSEAKGLEYVLGKCRVLKEHDEEFHSGISRGGFRYYQVVDVADSTCIPQLAQTSGN